MKKKELQKIFRVPEGYTIDEIESQKEVHKVYCHVRKQGYNHEGEYSKTVTERRIRVVQHVMIEDSIVELVITQRRFRFHKQKTCRWEELPGIEKRGKTSNEFRKNSLRELQTQNYSQSSKKRGKVIIMPPKF